MLLPVPASRWQLLSYGLFGLPLALVALPIYVYAPQFYSSGFGLPLSLIGIALLLARTCDALVDPLLGVLLDRTRNGLRRFIIVSLPLMAAGFVALFHPASIARENPFTWFLCSLALVYTGFSIATIAHQSWGAALTQAPRERARVTAFREACGLVGVLLASALPTLAGIGTLSTVFVLALAGSAVLLLFNSPRPLAAPNEPPATVDALPDRVDESLPMATAPRDATSDKLRPSPLHVHAWSNIARPFRSRQFRWLFAVFAVNGTAAAIPATLFLFFTQDRLALGSQSGFFLLLYFTAGAASLPLWTVLAGRHGEARAWLAAMLLAVAAFAWAFALVPGNAIGFGAICIASGIALGADLALPPALLAAVIGRAGDSGQREGAYFGVWSWATKMNLALAAGIALPLLDRLGYTPGRADPAGLHALGIAYALLPCLLKSAAASLLWRSPLRDL
jgi:GPH family glycoside/pentoside/hexuronide:cation symporter